MQIAAITKAALAVLISDRINFKTKKTFSLLARDKEGHWIMIKGSIQ